jgi:hypothetical protein
MPTNNLSEAEIPDKEQVKVGENENGAPASTSAGEYSEEKKAVLGAMKSHYGEDVSADDGEYTSKLEGMVTSDLLPKAGKLKSYDEANTKLLAMMDSEPELSGTLADMGKGSKFLPALKRHVDLKALMELPDDDSDETSWEANAKSREDKYAAETQRKAELAANEEKSLATIEKFVADKHLEGEECANFGKLVADFLDRAYSGDITESFLETMYYHMNRDKDLEQASTLGELKGRNSKIANAKFDEKDYAGDGMPHLSGSAGGSEEETENELDPMVASLNKHLDSNRSILSR